PKGELLTGSEIVTHASPRKGGFAADVQTRHAGSQESEARVAIQFVVWKHEKSAPEPDEPAPLQVVPGEGGGDAQVPERFDVEWRPTRHPGLERPEQRSARS